jgi:hypothetical protein
MEITLENRTLSPVVLFSVDSMKQERKEGVVRPGVGNSFYVPGIPPHTELRIKNFNTEATIFTHTTGEPPRSGESRAESNAWPPQQNPPDFYLNISEGAAVTTKLSGLWTYRSFNPTFVEGDQTAPQEKELIVAEGVFRLETPTSTTLKGAFEMWSGWFLDLLNGRVQPDALGYDTSSFEIVGTGRPDTATAGWEYRYHGHLTRWPDHIDDRPPLVGSVFRAKTHNGVPPRSPAGEVFSFIAVKQP